MHENMVNVEHGAVPWASPDHLAELRAASRRVFARAGARIYADIPRKELCFGYEDSDGWLHIQWFIRAFDVHTNQPKKIEGVAEDQIVNAIFFQRNVSRKVKMKWAEDMEAEVKKAKAEQQGKAFENARPEAEKVVKHVRDREGMGKTYRPSLVVNGLKGA